jgi:hypothetical protein
MGLPGQIGVFNAPISATSVAAAPRGPPARASIDAEYGNSVTPNVTDLAFRRT